MKKYENKNIYIHLIMIVIFGVSVGYAAMNRTLNITGSSKVEKNTWNVYFDNILVRDGSVEAELQVVDTTTKTTVDFSTTLNLPGDFYEFTVDVKNDGTIDAMIDSIENTLNLTDEQKKYISYTITYQCDKEIKAKHVVNSEDFLRVKVRVEYRTDITESDLPTIDQNLDLSFTLNYVQADSTGEIIKNNGIICANGEVNEIGTIATIGTDKFYIMGLDGDNVKLLSMYNLYVGNECSSYTGADSCVSYGEKATGMQDKNMRGNELNQNLRKGTTSFSNNEYSGTNYSDYSGSIVEGYVNNYKDKLEEKFGVDVMEARLITKDELIDSNTFACVENSVCSTKYPWIYSTSYWTGSAINNEYVLHISSNRGFFNSHAFYLNNYGVRPVIVISKTYFE